MIVMVRTLKNMGRWGRMAVTGVATWALLLAASTQGEQTPATEGAQQTPAAEAPQQTPAAEAPKKTPAAKAPAKTPSVADRIVAWTNAQRRSAGMRELRVDPKLNAAALQLAEHMARTGSFGHSADGRMPQHRVSAQQYQWVSVTENIAWRGGDVGSNPDFTAQQFMNQWLNSPGHRANIFGWQSTEIGVATATSAWGAVYAVQVFATPAVTR